VKNFKELKVWRKAHEVTLVLYKRTREFPREELYGLTIRFDAHRRRLAQTSPRGRVDGLTEKYAVFYRSRVDRQTNSSITCCSRMISIFWANRSFGTCLATPIRSREC